MTLSMPMELIVEKRRTTILFEGFFQVRRIWTDDRPHPADPDPTVRRARTGRNGC